MSEEIGFFYGSTTGMTEDVAFKMEQVILDEFEVSITPINIIDLDDPNDMFVYKRLILGMPTWNYGEYQDDWELAVDQIAGADLHGTTIAMFGLGDQVGYPEYYLDALGMIAEQLTAQGAKFIGEWPNDESYEFESSKALLDNGNFIGLALDEDSQPEKTDARVKAWVRQVLPQLRA